MLKEKALRTIKAEFKEYKQRILTNLSLAKYAGMDKRMFGERRELK